MEIYGFAWDSVHWWVDNDSICGSDSVTEAVVASGVGINFGWEGGQGALEGTAKITFLETSSVQRLICTYYIAKMQ